MTESILSKVYKAREQYLLLSNMIWIAFMLI